MVGIGIQVEIMMRADFRDKEICDLAIEVIASEMRVAVGRKDFKDTVLEFQNGNIEGSPAKIIDGNRTLSLLLEPIGQRGSGRFIDDP